jgi:Anti-sigma-K factor rskA/Putative zinc-finger
MSEVHSAVGAYAVDALSADERAEFESHLAGCHVCQFEAAQFAETVAELAPLVAMTPPPALRSAVLDAIAGTRQLPRERVARTDSRTRSVTDSGDEAPRRQRVASVTELRPPGPPNEVAPLEEHPSVVPDTPWLGITASLSDEMDLGRSRRRDRMLALIVAVALVMAVVFSGWAYISYQHERAQMAMAQRENDLFTAPDANLIKGTVNGSPVSFVVSKERNQALFIANDLRDPPEGSVYQVWRVAGGTYRPDRLIRDGGSVRQWLEGPVRQSDGLALSIEPAPKGSLTPTGDKVLLEESLG